jgi:acyl-CoA synthetase (NDP forming)
VKEVPDNIDLALICVPAASVLQVIRECTEAGVKMGVVITSGFAEVDEEGRRSQQEIVNVAKEGGMRIVGPNCMGIMSSNSNLCALMNMAIPKKGNVSMVSQSGTLGTLAMMLASAQGIGFSKFISSGNEADLHLEDFVEYLADDPETKVILFFIEGIRDGKKFFRVTREATKKKPIIALKGGKSELAAKAAQSHTGSMIGSTATYDAVFKQAGIIQAQDDRDMIDLIKAFSLLPLPKGRRVGFITPSGGYTILVSDACANENLDLPELSPRTIQELNRMLPSFWSHRNPVDMTASGAGMFGGGVDMGILPKGVELVLRDENIDAVVCMAPAFDLMINEFVRYFPQTLKENLMPMIEGLGPMMKKLTEDLVGLREKCDKPISTVGMGTNLEAVSLLADNGIPVYETPYQAIHALSKLVDYKEYVLRHPLS